jgi:hypothetical protein
LYLFFGEATAVFEEYFFEQDSLFIKIGLESKIEFLSLFTDIDDGVSVIYSFGRSRAVCLSLTGG